MTTKAIDQMTPAEQAQEIARLRAENEKLQKTAPKTDGGLKVSEKGCVSVYLGRRRWPVTLYAQEMLNLLDKADHIKDFIEKNRAKLSFREAPATTEQDGNVQVG